MAGAYVGTSGWNYAGWRGRFYPEDLPSRDYLRFYTGTFATTEVNYSFYHLPRPQTYAVWAAQVPAGFVFAVKASRLVTHTKRLKDVGEPWGKFTEHARVLGERLGPILLQFPPGFAKDEDRLAAFLALAREEMRDRPPLRLVFEFRHESWFAEPVYRLLRAQGAALCIADSPRYPRREVVTADFTYFRFHGRTKLFASRYAKKELAEEARAMKRRLADGLDVYAYFNNDASGHAVGNARTLAALLGASVE